MTVNMQELMKVGEHSHSDIPMLNIVKKKKKFNMMKLLFSVLDEKKKKNVVKKVIIDEPIVLKVEDHGKEGKTKRISRQLILWL
mmetsp:Transcript_5222/g.6863  ORF Transcript_5222/g.6863 Transcript_5222/m.6863 type:complete len:84 (-) Transcript_5222:19-270(-)